MLAVNDVINGTYQIIREIGHGGTGVVYLGYHLNLQKYIVLKRITANISDINALRREADILKNLRHSNIPQIYDFIMENGEIFTVMDYIEGRSMDDYLRGANSYSEGQLMTWFQKLTDVLEYLQTGKNTVIHSDIKPGNIMITPQGEPILIDFNISLDANAGGRIVGFSPHYASPEQAWMAHEISQGKTVDYRLDERTDIYSLGAVFYTLTSGLVPESSAVMPKLETMPGLIYSKPFLAAIDKCMEWDRENRFRNAGKLNTALHHLYRLDRNYRQSITMRVICAVISAMIFAGGVFCTVHGIQQYAGENLGNRILEISEAVQYGNYELAGIEANKILDSWTYRLLLRDGEEKAKLYHIAGDSAYLTAGSKGSEKGYRQASEYYRKAVDLLMETDSMYLPGYCADLALAYQKCGDTQSLRELLEFCQQNNINGAELKLVEALNDADSGGIQDCLQKTDEILGSGEDGEVKAKACLIAAQAAGDDQGIEYLRKVPEYTSDLRYLRICARAEYNRAGKAGLGDAERQSCAAKAVKLYETICSVPQPVPEDQINLGIAYYIAGKPSECVTVLQKAGEEKQWYQIDMYLALAYEELGDGVMAAQYCNSALKGCEAIGGAGSDDYSVLQDLQNRL